MSDFFLLDLQLTEQSCIHIYTRTYTYVMLYVVMLIVQFGLEHNCFAVTKNIWYLISDCNDDELALNLYLNCNCHVVRL